MSVDADGNLWVTSEDGNTPEFSYDHETGNLYVVADGTNVLIGNVRGIQGIQGEKGEKGDKGDQGEQGIQGIQGIQGVQGERGEKGDKGDKGDTGAAGSDASVTTANITAALGYTPAKDTDLNKKANDFSIELYNGNKGNPTPVRFASFNYSTCNSENGIAAKIGMVSGHGNGSSYAFLQDAIIKVSYAGAVSVDNFKYYGASAGTYDGAARQYGDIFWVVDTTNKIVDFYCLMGQYARVNTTPWRRLTYSSKGTVTQPTSCTVYSSGEKVWANNSDIALMSDIPTVPTLSTESWTFTLEDGSTVSKSVYVG
jgi:hypothetical protein